MEEEDKVERDEDISLDEVEEPEVNDFDEAEEADDDDVETSEAEADDEDEDVIVSINGEAPDLEEEEEARAPEWVRDLRKQYRDEKKRSKELEQKLQRLEQGQAPAAQTLGDKPTLDSVDYDTERYETEIATWYEKKRSHDQQQASVQAEQQSVQNDWNKKLEGYHSSKASLKVKDYDIAEDVVQDNLSVMQQGMIVQGAENPALLVYALGKNPKKAKELASITDPVKFAFAVAKLETNLKVTKRKASSRPESKINGTGRPSGSVDNTLDRLRAEAEKTGNYTKVSQYKKQKQSA
jgi:hypothetical protein|tara:strand:- start:2245 stop:3129 length:885 start_codon:yes stop_codon:yes gene_type:complete